MSMVEARTADLIGPALDWAVAKTEKVSVEITTYWWGECDLEIVGSEDENGIAESYSPSSDWSQGGPLIEKYQISIMIELDGSSRVSGWIGREVRPQTGETPLIAACRAIVAAKLGDVVSVPAELVSK